MLAASLGDVPPDLVPDLLRDRLSADERGLLERAAAAAVPTAEPADCVNALRRLRIERDRAAVQDEIDRLQAASPASNDALAALWARKMELLRRLEELGA
jgi:hypothetical protein